MDFTVHDAYALLIGVTLPITVMKAGIPFMSITQKGKLRTLEVKCSAHEHIATV